jgi:hypothetical protein
MAKPAVPIMATALVRCGKPRQGSSPRRLSSSSVKVCARRAPIPRSVIGGFRMTHVSGLRPPTYVGLARCLLSVIRAATARGERWNVYLEPNRFDIMREAPAEHLAFPVELTIASAHRLPV